MDMSQLQQAERDGMNPYAIARQARHEQSQKPQILATVRCAGLSAAMRERAGEIWGVDAAVVREYRPVIVSMSDLDNAGEPCTVCQLEGRTVEVQWRAERSQQWGETCRPCLPRQLQLAGILSDDGPLTLEVLGEGPLLEDPRGGTR